MIRVLGFDPSSTKNQGWAVLDLVHRSWVFVSCGVWRAQIDLFVASEDFKGVELVAIESAKKVYQRARFGLSMATGLAGAQRSAGILIGQCQAKDIPCVEVEAGEVRRHVVGRPNATNGEVKRCVKMLIRGWPTQSSEHSRDAALTAVFGHRKFTTDQVIKRQAL